MSGTVKITRQGTHAILEGFRRDMRLITIIKALQGDKLWLKDGRFRFAATPENLDLMLSLYEDAKMVDGADEAKLFEETLDVSKFVKPKNFTYRKEPYKFQLRCLAKWDRQRAFAVFMEMGTGKTFVTLNKAAELYLAGEITAVLIMTKKRVHTQWITEQIPENFPSEVPAFGWAWDNKIKNFPPELLENRGPLKFFSINLDAIKYDDRLALAQEFCRAHKMKVMVVVDESQLIKSLTAVRSKKARAVRKLCNYAAILTGTPIAKTLEDEWAQFYFLDPSIIGEYNQTAFRSRYCTMGGFDGREITGYKQLDRFTELTQPYIFRATKREELDLPEKVFKPYSFDLEPDQRRIYDEMRIRLLGEIESGIYTSAANAATSLVRLQQIASGFVVSDDGVTRTLANPRLDAMLDVASSISGKKIIWARFHQDIEFITSVLPKDSFVTYYGPTKEAKKDEAKQTFIEKDHIEYFIGTAASAGAGLDGVQRVCGAALYYTNTYAALDRWQSEDRIHRIGMTGALYVDLIANKTLDRPMLGNIRQKKDLSDLVLDDLRLMLEA